MKLIKPIVDIVFSGLGWIAHRWDIARCAVLPHDYRPVTSLSDGHYAKACRRCKHVEWVA